MLVDPPDSVDTWSSALSEVWDDEARYEELSQLAREHSERNELDVGMIVERFETLLAHAIDRHRQCG